MTKWSTSEKEDLELSMSAPFHRKSPPRGNKKSEASKERERSKTAILKRISFQIDEMKSSGLPMTTPEEWDKGFYLLGGGSSRRKSRSILSRMTWDEFLEFVNIEEEVCREKK